MVEITINGQKREFDAGKTLLECVEETGLQLPTLCHHKALEPYGACRLCLVEVASNGRPATIQTACNYPAQNGLTIQTDSERVMRARRVVIELLRARCPDSAVIKKMADDLGVTEIRIKTKDDDCIYCGLCVRMCEEKMGRSAIGITGRGPDRQVETPFSKFSEECWVCGACDFICPTRKTISSSSRDTEAKPILDEYNTGLNSRPAIYQMYPQMIPNAPLIDKQACTRLQHDECGICKEVCKAGAISYDDSDRESTLDVGAVILAPGYNVFDAQAAGEFGYGRYPNVITSLEFERILSATGPFQGHILRPHDKNVPKKIAFIQCIGSRDTKHMYCSSICCMYATKEAVIAKEHNPDLDCTIFFRDIRAFGKGYEEYYERAKAEGIHYIKASPSTVKQVPLNKNLTIQYSDKGSDIVEDEFDLVVLCVGILSGPSRMLGDMLGLELNEDGFIHMDPLYPIYTSKEGVFVAGVASGPKDIPEAVMESDAAASRCLNLLSDVRGQQIAKPEYPPERDVSAQEPKVGVFICHCGTNIAGVINVPDVVEYTLTLPNVAYAENNLYTCSADTCERIKELIIEKDLNRLVIASCTPRTHEPLFMDTMKQSGLNPYLFEMANIRDQCSWVHMQQPDEATAKAKDLVRMAVAKVEMNESLYPQFVDVTKAALIIGGGIGGLTAALELGGQGFDVFLVEKEKELGGQSRKIHFSPDGDVGEKLSSLIDSVQENAKIKIYTEAEVASVEGSVPNFETVISEKGKEITVKHGAVVVATGAQEHKPEQYLYQDKQQVLTQTEFEEKLGQGFDPGRDIVMIQCVGSREEPRDYCSRVCCSKAVKNALKVKELSPETSVTILNRDIRTYGFYEKLYRESREKGIKYIRFDENKANKPSVSSNGRLTVTVHDLLLDMEVELPADTVVLASAIESLESNSDVAKLLKVPLNKHGFFLEAHMKLRPVDFATDGVFVCGTAHSPKNISETILQSMAASTRAGVILSQEQMEIEPRISVPIDANCDGCAYCIEPCPYNAIELIEYMRRGAVKKTVDVDITLCHGCGTCMATCPKKGIFVRNFSLEQLGRVVEAGLDLG